MSVRTRSEVRASTIGTSSPASSTDVAVLEVTGVDAGYGQVQVLFGVSLEVPRGEIVAVVGPNGAGKTTLLRTIAGLHPARKGSIRLDGVEIGSFSTEARAALGLGVMFGGEAVFGDLSVEGNLAAGGDLLRREPGLLRRRIAEAFDVFPRLGERRKALAIQLSGGEQQMLALAKAFLLRPKVLCIDELSLGLAPVVVERLVDVLRDFRSAGLAVLLVEQSLTIALDVADQIVYFERGEVNYTGAAGQLASDPELLHSLFLKGDER